jgi:hypothetical protein
VSQYVETFFASVGKDGRRICKNIGMKANTRTRMSWLMYVTCGVTFPIPGTATTTSNIGYGMDLVSSRRHPRSARAFRRMSARRRLAVA